LEEKKIVFVKVWIITNHGKKVKFVGTHIPTTHDGVAVTAASAFDSAAF